MTYSADTVAQRLREDVLARLGLVLAGVEEVEQSDLRLFLQSCCLDALTALEDIIDSAELERRSLANGNLISK